MENDVSTQPKDQEPSMEEILSSIRRIIADEETEDAKPDEELEGASGAAEPSELDELDVLDDDDDDDADDISDVLELTSVVDDQGGIVELDAGSQAPVSLELVDDSDDDDHEDIEIDDFMDEDIGEAEEELTLPEIDLSSLEDDEPDPEPESVHTMPVNAMDATTLQEDEPAVSTKKAESEALLSTGTASTTTGAFAKLSKAFRPTPVEESVADGAGRTVEQFIEDMARPMLKEWLDENMPAIVERLVQKEIQKIARRAELL
jgi:uncharacterized protein